MNPKPRNFFLSPGRVLSLVGLSLFFSACVEFKSMSLYDGTEPVVVSPRPALIETIVEPVIYYDQPKDMWGLESNACQVASISKEAAFSGSESIKLDWNRNAVDCKWAGIGIGWDGYAGKDLTEVMAHAAIEMRVRAQKGKMFGLPFVLTLEDYSGGMGFCFTDNKYFERTLIDQEWQKVTVPLSDFELQTENLDPSNIKQLQIELQQQGSVYLDDIKLIWYTPEPVKPWMVEEKRPDPTDFPVLIFGNSFINDNGWGLVKNDCIHTRLENRDANGDQFIHATWQKSAGDCGFTAMGASWNKWFPVDLSRMLKNSAIQFDIQLIKGGGSQPIFQIGFEDYDRGKSMVAVASNYVNKGMPSTWSKVQVPMSDLPPSLDFTRIKQLYIQFEGDGEAYLDNIQLVELKIP